MALLICDVVQIYVCDYNLFFENKEQCRCKQCRWSCKECKRCRPKAKEIIWASGPSMAKMGKARVDQDPWPAKDGDVEPWKVDRVVVEGKWGCAWRNEEG